MKSEAENINLIISSKIKVANPFHIVRCLLTKWAQEMQKICLIFWLDLSAYICYSQTQKIRCLNWETEIIRITLRLYRHMYTCTQEKSRRKKKLLYICLPLMFVFSHCRYIWCVVFCILLHKTQNTKNA